MGEVKKEEEKEEKRVNGKIRGNVEMLRGKRSVSWYGGKRKEGCRDPDKQV